MRALTKVLLAGSLLFSSACLAQTDGISQPTIRVDSSLVLVDVITQDAKALPALGLKKEDFQVFDNGSDMPIRSFDVGARYATRPIALWLVVICNQKDWDENGSGFIRGKGPLLRPALEHLDKNDTIGVAHWCDDGTQRIDFMPARDPAGALGSMEQLLRDSPKNTSNRPGELALQRMLRLVLENADHANPKPLPVMVFLYADHSGMPRKEAEDLVKELLETSVIVFGINDGGMPLDPAYLENQSWCYYVAHFLTAMTGGQYFSVEPNMFATALDDILVQVHFRYVLGFQPDALDGKTHKLTVELTDSAKLKHPSTRLAFRPAYVPVKTKPRSQ